MYHHERAINHLITMMELVSFHKATHDELKWILNINIIGV